MGVSVRARMRVIEGMFTYGEPSVQIVFFSLQIVRYAAAARTRREKAGKVERR